MEKQVINCQRSRAKAEIHTHGGRVIGQHQRLPIVYAVPPLCGPVWAVYESVQISGGVRQTVHTSYINGCTVIWR